MELALDLIALYAGIIVPVIAAIIIWGSKTNAKLAVLVDTVKAHGIESKLSEAELDTLKLKVAMLQKDIEFIKTKVFGTGSPI